MWGDETQSILPRKAGEMSPELPRISALIPTGSAVSQAATAPVRPAHRRLSGMQLLLMLKSKMPRPGCSEAFGHVGPCGVPAGSWHFHSLWSVCLGPPLPTHGSGKPRHPWSIPWPPGLQVWQERDSLHKHLMNSFHGNLSWLQPVMAVLRGGE